MNELNCPGIYRLTCIPNGKVYVGRSINVHTRLIQHRQHAKTKKIPLYCAIRKYGWENFQVDLLERVDDPAQLIPREQFWIDTLHAAEREHGYNLCPRGDGPQGFKHGPEMRAKLSARKGEKRPPKSDAEKTKMRARRPKPESIAKQKATCERKRVERLAAQPPKQPKQPKQIRPPQAKFGSEEHRAKLSAAQKLRTDMQTPEYRERQRIAQLKRWENRPPKPPKLTPEETIARMHEAHHAKAEQRSAERLARFWTFIGENPEATVNQIAEFMAIKQDAAYRLMKEAGYKRNQTKRDDLKTYLLERKNQWTTLKELAAHFETTSGNIHYWLHLEGFVKKDGRWQIPKEQLT